MDYSDTMGKLELVRKITEYAKRIRDVADRHASLASFYGRISDQLASSAVLVTNLAESYPESELAQFLIGQFSTAEPIVSTATERAEFAISEVEEDSLRNLAPATSTSSILSLTVPPLIVDSSPEDVRAEWEAFLATYDVELELSTVRRLLIAACSMPPLSPDLLDDFDDAVRDYKTKPANRKYAGLCAPWSSCALSSPSRRTTALLIWTALSGFARSPRPFWGKDSMFHRRS